MRSRLGRVSLSALTVVLVVPVASAHEPPASPPDQTNQAATQQPVETVVRVRVPSTGALRQMAAQGRRDRRGRAGPGRLDVARGPAFWPGPSSRVAREQASQAPSVVGAVASGWPLDHGPPLPRSPSVAAARPM
jgi:hypothetical protein